MHSLVVLTVNLVLLLYTLCIFNHHLEFGKLVLSLATVLLGYLPVTLPVSVGFSSVKPIGYCFSYQVFSYSSWFYNIYVVNVVFYFQALYQALSVVIQTFKTFTSAYVLFCLSLVD